ncbi:MAG TPA: glycosyltransferase family 2 protein [Terriglobales bacterium]|jgi:GT2 family glycosyltransferase|nr:glycosyltransferase family 2 protein [Terriglobales bacterium]
MSCSAGARGERMGSAVVRDPKTEDEAAHPLISVLLVTYNSADHLQRCLESLVQQDYPLFEIIIVDNASIDKTRNILSQFFPPAQIHVETQFNAVNTGFAAAQNQAIRQAHGEWLLCLNPDVFLRPDFISQLVSVAAQPAGAKGEKVGAVCGKLLRWTPGAQPEFTSTIDCTGMYFTRNLRHLDRGAEQIDQGQYDRAEYVFGASGAAALYRREMVDDISVAGEFFDEDFFAYREDADLAWRAQILGWQCLYTPRAVGWHVRRVTPERRERLPHLINWHSVKNRFLMRIKNCSAWLYGRLFLPVTMRDVMILGYAALRNWKLFSALFYPLRRWRRFMRKRQWIQSRRKVSDRQLLFWFSNQPASAPVTTSPLKNFGHPHDP